MLIDDPIRREIGREAIRFCRRCPRAEERLMGEYTVLSCQQHECRLWLFLRILGVAAGTAFDAPLEAEALLQAHAREVSHFRGLLPIISPAHDWEADARFHDLAPEAGRQEAGGEGNRTIYKEETKWR